MIRKESLQSAQVHWPRLLLVAVAILLPLAATHSKIIPLYIR